MRDKLLGALRIAAAAIIGYAVIGGLTILGLEVWLGGFSWADSTAAELVAGALVSVVAGLTGGYVAAWIAGARPVVGALAVWFFLLIDMTFVLTSGRFSDPIWFSLAGAATLFVTTVVAGYWRRAKLQARPA